MYKRLPLLLLSLATIPAGSALAQAGAPATAGRIITVRMVDRSATEYAFEPAEITARPGDVIRFVQTSATMPHNVEFRTPPAGSNLGAARSGPLIMQQNQVYELSIDARFVAGTYAFVCTPHEALGMRGTLTIQP